MTSERKEGVEIFRSNKVDELLAGAESLDPGKYTFRITDGSIIIIDKDNAEYKEKEEFRAVGTLPEIHRTEADEITCIAGTMHVRVGGILAGETPALDTQGRVRPNEFVGTGIIGGTLIVLNSGDSIRIDPELPHLHTSAPDSTSKIAAAKFTKATKEPRFPKARTT